MGIDVSPDLKYVATARMGPYLQREKKKQLVQRKMYKSQNLIFRTLNKSTFDLSHIPDFILNLYVFMPFLYNLFPYDGQNCAFFK
jgi:hypothetical protein